jgi:ubiquinone/menaquinone biosynthesis C-methylase UbiE
MFIKPCIVRSGFPAALLLSFSVLSFAQNPDLSQYSNKFAPYVATPEHAVDRMLEVANLKPGETLFDLGCGDGRVLITAVQKYKVKAVGIEISDHLARSVAEKVKKEGLQDQIKIVHGDFMRQDLSSANVVTLYLATTANDTLRPNLERYLKPNSRVVSYDYPIPGWKPMETTEAKGTRGISHTIYLYQVPDSIKK